ncbi:MAG: lipopolysaccharide heptosyltransferase II [Verrucomicrobiae bacterium]|nr:lipopolysaccharide heptosyltransferase II [Verrucomicrobiae bacterium]
MNARTTTHQPPSQRILVRGVNWLGDAVMTTPALLRLRERFPQARITLLTPEKLRDLWKRHPAVNETLEFSQRESAFAVARRLRAGKFDLAFVLPNSPRSALEVWLAGIPRRIGYARPWRNWFLTQSVTVRPEAVRMRKRSLGEIRNLTNPPLTPHASRLTYPVSAHQLHEYLHLASALGASADLLPPQLFVGSEEIAAARIKFGLNETTAPILGLNPGAEYGPAKRWPVERFIATARELQQRTDCVWLILGGKKDADLAARIEVEVTHHASRIPPKNFAGQTSLRELMALLRLCRALLTNDTGPTHVAAALGTPVVVPFGSTSPELTGPGLPGDPRHRLLKSDAPCSPCYLRECPIDFRCMNGISVERVTEAVLNVLSS